MPQKASDEFRERAERAEKEIARLPARTPLGLYAKAAAIEAISNDEGSVVDFDVLKSIAADVKRLARDLYKDQWRAERGTAEHSEVGG